MNMTDSESDPLDEIFVDSEDMDRELIANILRLYVQIGDEAGQLYPTDEYAELKAEAKVLIALVARRAMAERDVVDSAVLSVSDLSSLSNVKEGTVKPNVRSLAEEGLIRDDDDGYSVAAPQLHRISSYFDPDE
jgi:hypothetical protein